MAGRDEDNRYADEGDSPPPRGRPDEPGPERDEYDAGERRPERSIREDKDRGDRDRRHREDVDRPRERDYDRDRERDHGRERERERDRRHREEPDRRRERHTSRDHDRDHDRERDRDRDRRRKSRDRTRSRSRSRSRDRSDRRKKQSGFDMAPPGATITPVPMPGMMVTPPAGMLNPAASTSSLPSIGAMAGQLGMGQPGMPGMFPGMFPMMGTQATRHARRVYVGGLPPMANEQSVATFFSQAMAAVGGNTAGPGDAVVNVYINQEKKFAFVECRTVEEASNAMALDGIIFEGVSVRVRRPSDYNPSMAAALGPSQPSPHLNLAAVGLTPGAAGGADGPDRIFVGGLPYYLTEEQIKELLSSFGPLRAFDLVKDRDTGNSKGYGFCVYQDPNVTDIACAALNGMKMGDKVLTVRRATASGQPKPDQANVLAQAQQQIALQVGTALSGGFNYEKFALQASGAPLGAMGGMGTMGLSVPGMLPGMMPGMGLPGLPGAVPEIPTKVVCLAQVVAPNELSNDEDYEEIMEDMREECGKYGAINNLVIPRPGPNGEQLPGVGKVFVEYTDTAGSMKAKQSLNGRKFGGNTVVALYYPEERFARADYAGQ